MSPASDTTGMPAPVSDNRSHSPGDRLWPPGAQIESVIIGGMPITVLSIEDTATMMMRAVSERPRGYRPLFMTSANGEVIARYHREPALAAAFDRADFIHADGQPMVVASRYLARKALPERVATTDLFDVVARKAIRQGATFYLLGASEDENRRAYETVRSRHPELTILGRSHGYLSEEELARKIEEIDALAPDILWVGLGVPREQEFYVTWGPKLRNVGIIKTCGGLFNFMSGKNSRAPLWMQRHSLEWVWRLGNEPRRLFWRYLTTNPRAFLLMLRHTR